MLGPPFAFDNTTGELVPYKETYDENGLVNNGNVLIVYKELPPRDDNLPFTFGFRNLFGVSKHDRQLYANLDSDQEQTDMSDSSSYYEDIPDPVPPPEDWLFQQLLAESNCCGKDGRIFLYPFTTIPAIGKVPKSQRPVKELQYVLSTPEYKKPPSKFYYNPAAIENLPYFLEYDPDGCKRFGLPVNMFFMVYDKTSYEREYRKWLRGEMNVAFSPFSCTKNKFACASRSFQTQLCAFMFSEWLSYLMYMRKKIMTGKYGVKNSGWKELHEEAYFSYSSDYMSRKYRKNHLCTLVRDVQKVVDVQKNRTYLLNNIF